MSRGIIVLGMHRSGTSALTRTLNLLGLHLQHEQLVASGADNPTGFWEYEDLVQAHQRFFYELRFGPYGPVGPIDASVWSTPQARWLQGSLREVLEQHVLSAPSWVIKDPRLCRLLPVWLPLLAQTGVAPSFVLMLRNPTEIAASLRARERMPEELSHWYWLSHVLDAELLTRPYPRTLVTYDALMRDPRGTAQKLATDLGLEPASVARAGADIDAFLDADLRHHAHASAADERTFEGRLAEQLWRAIASAQEAPSPARESAFDAARARWEGAFTGPAGEALFGALEVLRRTYEELNYEAKERQKTDEHLNVLLNSRSWRITAPLRAMRERLRHA